MTICSIKMNLWTSCQAIALICFIATQMGCELIQKRPQQLNSNQYKSYQYNSKQYKSHQVRPHNPATCSTTHHRYSLRRATSPGSKHNIPLSQKEADAWNAAHQRHRQPQINAENRKKENLNKLFAACANPQTTRTQIETILKLKLATIDTTNEDGLTPLMLASMHASDPGVIAALVAAGAKVDSWSPDFGKQMVEIAFAKLPKTMSDLAKAMVMQQRFTMNLTPLMLASMSNKHEEIVIALLESGANANERNENGASALALASTFNANPQIITVLHEAGGRLNARNQARQTLLHSACQLNPNHLVIKRLLALGLDANAKDMLGATPVTYAASYNTSPKVIQTLIAGGANVNFIPPQIGLAPLTIACGMNSNPEVIRTLLNLGANPHGSKTLESSPLFAACALNGNIEIIDILLDAGCDINTHYGDNRTVLHEAALLTQDPKLISHLLKRGANPNLRDNNGRLAIDDAKENPALANTNGYWELNDATQGQ